MFIVHHLVKLSPITKVGYPGREGLAFEIRFSNENMGFVRGWIEEETAKIQADRLGENTRSYESGGGYFEEK